MFQSQAKINNPKKVLTVLGKKKEASFGAKKATDIVASERLRFSEKLLRRLDFMELNIKIIPYGLGNFDKVLRLSGVTEVILREDEIQLLVSWLLGNIREMRKELTEG